MKTWLQTIALGWLCLSAALPAQADPDFYSESLTLGGSWDSKDVRGGKAWSGSKADQTSGLTAFTSLSAPKRYLDENAFAYAGVGTLKAFSFASVFSTDAVPNGGVGAEARAEARSTNVVTINSAGLAGKSGSLTFSTMVSGLIYSELHWRANDPPSGHNGVDFRITVNGQPAAVLHTSIDFSSAVVTSTECLWERGNPVCFDATLGAGYVPVTVRVPIVYGVPITVDARLSTFTLGQTQYNQGYFSAFADMSHSVYWGGIQDVAFDGQSVNYSIASDSALDWMKNYTPAAVPEPASVLMLLGGLSFLSRRFRQTRA